MKKLFPFFCILLVSCSSVSIEETTYLDRPHFRISTETATYFLDKAGGGLSRLIDPEGTDWICYQGDPHAEAPSGASGGFRGIPNLVYRSGDGGAGHPGFDQCISEKVGKHTIRTRTKSGKWVWTWKFYPDHASITMEKTDPDHAYWFLYEGPVAGSFRPGRKYWGTDLGGPRYEVPSLNQGENISGNWQWAYFGDRDAERVFFLAQDRKDILNDYFAYMGDTDAGNDAADGMVVFGFGRDKGVKALMTEAGVTFRIGFLDRKIGSARGHAWAAAQIDSLNRKEQ